MSGTPLRLRLLVAFALSLVVHALLMSSEQVHAAQVGDRDGTRHDHCATEAGACGRHATNALSHPANVPADETCGPLTPWKSTNGDGGERLDRAAPVITAPAPVTDTGPMPGEPAYLDPPDVRRAFLQVYRN